METEKVVQKQLEMDFSAHTGETSHATTPQTQAKIICFVQSRQALAAKANLAPSVARTEIIKSRIDSLLARYK